MLIGPDKFDKALELLSQTDLVAIDTETYWTDDYENRLIIGVSVYCRLDESGKYFGAYFPFRHESLEGYGTGALLDCNLHLDKLRTLANCLNEVPHHIFHNRKFDALRFAYENAPLTSPFYCTMVLSHMLDENSSHKLEDLAEHYRIDPGANARQKNLHNLRKKVSWHKIDVNLMGEYAVGDVRNTYNLLPILQKRLEAQGLWELWEDQEAWGEDLLQAEMRGMQIDRALAAEYSASAYQRMIDIEKELGFEPTKVAQLAKVLFIDLALPIYDRGKPTKQFPEGRPVMDEAALNVLGRLVPDNPTVNLVLEYRGLQKARSTWYEGWQHLSDSSNRLHPTFNQHGTVSTRLSANSPNVEQIPRDADTTPVKKLLRCTEGYELWSFDFSQLEYRIITSYCGQPDMIEAYQSGSDFHTLTASKLGIERYLAKNVNFTLAYLGGPGALKRYMPQAEILELREIHTKFHRDYKQLVATAERCNNKAAKYGYVKLWTGHRCRFEVYYETKKAWNRVVQGAGAQIFREASKRINRDPELKDCHIVNFVHDDFWIEIPTGLSQYRIPRIKYHMEWPSRENQEFWKIPYLAEARCLWWSGMK